MRPIPTIEDPERYIDSAFVDSAFIELKSCDLWDVKMLYPLLNMDHAEEKCFVRKEMYDAGVLKYTGLETGREMTFAEFERIVEEKILQPGYGKVICGDCQWRDICHK